MTAAREAIQLPILFLTVLLLGAIHVADRVALRPPSLFGLVLGVVLLGLLVRSGAWRERLMHTTRPRLANLKADVIVAACWQRRRRSRWDSGFGLRGARGRSCCFSAQHARARPSGACVAEAVVSSERRSR